MPVWINLLQILKKVKNNYDKTGLQTRLGPIIKNVVRLYSIGVGEVKSKIDRDKFIKLWKNSVPYEIIARHFGVTVASLRDYKSRNCRGITRNVVCPRCGSSFVTKIYNKTFCNSCLFESKVNFFNRKCWMKKLEEGTRVIEERRDAGLLYEEELDIEKYRKIEERPDWWD